MSSFHLIPRSVCKTFFRLSWVAASATPLAEEYTHGYQNSLVYTMLEGMVRYVGEKNLEGSELLASLTRDVWVCNSEQAHDHPKLIRFFPAAAVPNYNSYAHPYWWCRRFRPGDLCLHIVPPHSEVRYSTLPQKLIEVRADDEIQAHSWSTCSAP